MQLMQHISSLLHGTPLSEYESPLEKVNSIQLLIFFVIFAAGSVFRVVTGFGSSLVVTGFWVIFKQFGANVGSLRQLVVTILVNMWITGIYLVVTTKPRENVAWPILAGSISASWAGCVVGSLALKVAPTGWLELLAGNIILATLWVSGELNVLSVLMPWYRQAQQPSEEEEVDLAQDIDELQSLAAKKDSWHETSLDHLLQGPIRRASITLRNSQLATEMANYEAVDDSYARSFEFESPAGGGDSIHSQHQHQSIDSPSPLFLWAASRMGPLNSLLPSKQQMLRRQRQEYPALPRYFNIVSQSQAGTKQTQRWHKWNLVWWGMACGLGTGFLGTSVGMPGPSMMLTMRLLDFPKDVQRATSGINSVISPRLVILWLLGLVRWAEWPLYSIAIVAGLFGGGVGTPLAARLDQGGFRRSISVLLFASGVLLVYRSLSGDGSRDGH